MLIWHMFRAIPFVPKLFLIALGIGILLQLVIIAGNNSAIALPVKVATVEQVDSKDMVLYPVTGKFYNKIKVYDSPKTVDGITLVAEPYLSPFNEKQTPEEVEQDVQQFVLALKRDTTVSNIRRMPRNWFLFDIENGTVTCREHAVFTALACWKK